MDQQAHATQGPRRVEIVDYAENGHSRIADPTDLVALPRASNGSNASLTDDADSPVPKSTSSPHSSPSSSSVAALLSLANGTTARRGSFDVVRRLPIEVVERILGHLIDVDDDADTAHYASLRTASVVCKGWSRSARRLLFRKVVLDADSAAKFVKQLDAQDGSKRRHIETLFVRNVFNSKLERLLSRIEGITKLILSIDNIEDEGIDIPAHLSSLKALVILRLSPFQIRPPSTIPVTPIRLTSFRYVIGQISALWIYRILESSRETIKHFDVEFPDDLTEGDCVEGWLPFLPLFKSFTIRNPQPWLSNHVGQCAQLKSLALDLDYDECSTTDVVEPIVHALSSSNKAIELDAFSILASRLDEQDLLIESSRLFVNEKSLARVKRVRFPGASDDDRWSFTKSPSYKSEMANEFLDWLAGRGVQVAFEANREYYS